MSHVRVDNSQPVCSVNRAPYVVDVSSAKRVTSIYQEAKGSGFDVKTLRRIIALRRQDENTVKEDRYLLDLYLGALGLDLV